MAAMSKIRQGSQLSLPNAAPSGGGDRAEAVLGLPCGRSGQIGAQVRRHVVHDPLQAEPLKCATKPIRELAIGVKIERLAGDRGALHDLAFNGEHGAAARDLFLASLSRSAPPRSVALLASTSRNRRETLSRASPSMNSGRPLVTLLRPFGARETIWLASFRLLTARTINRLFLVTLSVTGKPTRQPHRPEPLTNPPYILTS